MFTFQKTKGEKEANISLGNFHSQFELEFLGKNKAKLTKCTLCSKDLKDGDVCIIKDNLVQHANCKTAGKPKEIKPTDEFHEDNFVMDAPEPPTKE